MPGADQERLLAQDAIMDAIDDMIRARAAARDGPDRDEFDALLAERNRVARCLGRAEFTAPDLLLRGTDD
jgi:hypothetical protein